MKIISRESGEEYKGVIERASNADLRKVTKSNLFEFDWTVYDDYEVYKLTLAGKTEILGLIAVREHPEKGFQYVELKTIELSKVHKGAGKKLENIAGCLIAYGCLFAMNERCEGHVVINPKTVLDNHYIQKYGFARLTNKLLHSSYENSRKLIARYLDINIIDKNL